MKKLNYNAIVLAICGIIFVGLFMYANAGNTPPLQTASSYTAYETAKVLSIPYEEISLNSDLYEGKYIGNQQLLIEITSGTYKGTTMSAINYLGALYGSKMEEGDPVVAAIYISEGEVNNIVIYEYDRSLWIIVIVGAFALVTILIGGKKGAQSLLGLVFTIVSLIFILIPLLMKGFPTILTTFLLCIFVSAVSFILIDGISTKTVCAMLGSSAGLGLAALFGLAAQTLVRVDGMRMGDYVDALLQLKQTGSSLQLSGLLISGTIIASLGATMDVAMSIASAIHELKLVNPNLSKKDIWVSGMNIGRDMIGTMTNTLILAFVGSSLLLVIYIYSLNVPAYQLFSSSLVATELVHSIASSIGVILSVPLTVFISSIFYTKQK